MTGVAPESPNPPVNPSDQNRLESRILPRFQIPGWLMGGNQATPYPLSRHSPWGLSGVGAGRGTISCVSVASTSFMSCRLAPSTTTAKGHRDTAEPAP